MGYKLSDAQFSPDELYICTTGYETSVGCTIQAAPWRLDARILQPVYGGLSGKVNIADTPVLSWLAGMKATNHEVYLGDSLDAVRNATTDSPEYKGSFALGNESYIPENLKPDKTYWWKIVEVNNTETDKISEYYWNFSTVYNNVIDDFEEYNNSDSFANRGTWHDGYENEENGSRIGYEDHPFYEETNIRNGSLNIQQIYT